MDGILNIDKPPGPTSFSVVSRVRRMMGERKAGHGGTLDPLASGVLPVFLGQATRVAEYLMEYHKTYRAEVELGVATDSYDAEGEVTFRSAISGVTLEVVTAALDKFRGEIFQKPPVYSAIKQNGQPLHRLVRRGQQVEVGSRPVSIYRLELLGFEPPHLTLEVECSRGTYIRSLAHELGEALGCGAHLAGLVRTAYGPFDIKDAVTPQQLEESVKDGLWRDLLQPMDRVLSLWEKVELSAGQEASVVCGAGIRLDRSSDLQRLCAYGHAGGLVALLELKENGLWYPRKVMAQPQAPPPEVRHS